MTDTGEWRSRMEDGGQDAASGEGKGSPAAKGESHPASSPFPPPRPFVHSNAAAAWVLIAIFGLMVLYGAAIWVANRHSDAFHNKSIKDRADLRQDMKTIDSRLERMDQGGAFLNERLDRLEKRVESDEGAGKGAGKQP